MIVLSANRCTDVPSSRNFIECNTAAGSHTDGSLTVLCCSAACMSPPKGLAEPPKADRMHGTMPSELDTCQAITSDERFLRLM
jgi:hypothetical protein